MIDQLVLFTSTRFRAAFCTFCLTILKTQHCTREVDNWQNWGTFWCGVGALEVHKWMKFWLYAVELPLQLLKSSLEKHHRALQVVWASQSFRRGIKMGLTMSISFTNFKVAGVVFLRNMKRVQGCTARRVFRLWANKLQKRVRERGSVENGYGLFQRNFVQWSY